MYQTQTQGDQSHIYNTQPQTNPFLRSSKSQNFALSNPFGQQYQQQAYYQQAQSTGMSDGQQGYNQGYQQQAPASYFQQPQQSQQTLSGHLPSPQAGQQQSPFVQSPAPLQQHSTSPPPFDQAFQQHNQQNFYASAQAHFTAPVAQTQNPFAKLMPGGPNGVRSTVNRDSVDFQGLQNGRHSPDAFRGLSARVV
ncbi:hypothetical protein FH972_021191 [Carpinus fangiana]|uniref:Uncharacterized protein n=1 Tax=Carpinus fangiana TaxID=176857 RepID=A0A5N6KP03_9ROSI|nr:hypothetical protein FH972_021191 [Carpinus fangiana]